MLDLTSGAMFKVQGLNAWYGESHVLHGVNFEVREGEVVTLLGRNGAGKTTTMKSIMGLVPRRAGSIVLSRGGDHQDAARHRGRAAASRSARRSGGSSPG